MINFESGFKPEKADLTKDINERMQYIIEKIEELRLPEKDVRIIKQELNTFVEVGGSDVLEKIKQISIEVDMIMNYLVMLQAAVHDKNTHISIQEVLEKAGRSLANIYAILRREDVQDGESSISVYKTGEEPIQ